MGNTAPTTQITATPRTSLNRIVASLLFTWIYVGARRVDPAGTLPLSRSSRERRRREPVGVVGLIANRYPVFIQPSQRLLKQSRLRVTRRDGSLDNVEPVFAHVN